MDSLIRYLPQTIVQHLLSEHSNASNNAHPSHQLEWSNARPNIPTTSDICALARQDQHFRPPVTQDIEGAVLFADISGFTSITEHMNQTGGTDEGLANTLNSYFQMLTRIISQHQGIIMRFLGDALLVVFVDDPESTPPSQSSIQGYASPAGSTNTTSLTNSNTVSGSSAAVAATAAAAAGGGETTAARQERLAGHVRRAVECALNIKSEMAGFRVPDNNSQELSQNQGSNVARPASSAPDTFLSQDQILMQSHGNTAAPLINLSLEIKIGIGVGSMHVIHVDGGYGRVEYVLTGEPLIQSFSAESLVVNHNTKKVSAVVVAPPAWALVMNYFKAEKLKADPAIAVAAAAAQRRASNPDVHSGVASNNPTSATTLTNSNIPCYAFIESCISPRRQDKRSAFPISRTIYNDQIKRKMQQYLPQSVIPWVESGQERFLSELREVTVLFISTGLPEAQMVSFGSLAHFNVVRQVLVATQSAVVFFGGEINKFMLDDKGSTIIAVFGLPPKAHQDDALRGMFAALCIIYSLRQLTMGSEQLNPAIGLTTGRAFCGGVGSLKRKEYTVLGDSVNLAARLMQQSRSMQSFHMQAYSDAVTPNDIPVICDTTTMFLASSHISFKRVESVKVKGKTAPVEAFRPFAIGYNRFYPTLGMSNDQLTLAPPALLFGGLILPLDQTSLNKILHTTTNPLGSNSRLANTVSNIGPASSVDATSPLRQSVLNQPVGSNAHDTFRLSSYRTSDASGFVDVSYATSFSHHSGVQGGGARGDVNLRRNSFIVTRLLPTSPTISPLQGVFYVTMPSSDERRQSNPPSVSHGDSSAPDNDAPVFAAAGGAESGHFHGYQHPSNNRTGGNSDPHNDIVFVCGIGSASHNEQMYNYFHDPYKLTNLSWQVIQPSGFQDSRVVAHEDFIEYPLTTTEYMEHPVLIYPTRHQYVDAQIKGVRTSLKPLGNNPVLPNGSALPNLMYDPASRLGGGAASTLRLAPSPLPSDNTTPQQTTKQGTNKYSTLDMGHSARYLATPLQYTYAFNFLRAISFFVARNAHQNGGALSYRSVGAPVSSSDAAYPNDFSNDDVHHSNSDKPRSAAARHSEQDLVAPPANNSSSTALPSGLAPSLPRIHMPQIPAALHSLFPRFERVAVYLSDDLRETLRSIPFNLINTPYTTLIPPQAIMGQSPLKPKMKSSKNAFIYFAVDDLLRSHVNTVGKLIAYIAHDMCVPGLQPDVTSGSQHARVWGQAVGQNNPSSLSDPLHSNALVHTGHASSQRPSIQLGLHDSQLHLESLFATAAERSHSSAFQQSSNPLGTDVHGMNKTNHNSFGAISPVSHLSCSLTYTTFNNAAIDRLSEASPLTRTRYNTSVYLQELTLQHSLPVLSLGPLLPLQNSRTALISAQSRGSDGSRLFMNQGTLSLRLDYAPGYTYAPTQVKDPNNFIQHKEQRYLGHARDRVINLCLRHFSRPIRSSQPNSTIAPWPVTATSLEDESMSVYAVPSAESALSVGTAQTANHSSSNGEQLSDRDIFAASRLSIDSSPLLQPNGSRFPAVNLATPGAPHLNTLGVFSSPISPSCSTTSSHQHPSFAIPSELILQGTSELSEGDESITPTNRESNSAAVQAPHISYEERIRRRWALTCGSLDYIANPLGHMRPIWMHSLVEPPHRTRALVVMIEGASGLGKTLLLNLLKNESIAPMIQAKASALDPRPYSLVGSLIWQLLEQEVAVYESLHLLASTFYPQSLLPYDTANTLSPQTAMHSFFTPPAQTSVTSGSLPSASASHSQFDGQSAPVHSSTHALGSFIPPPPPRPQTPQFTPSSVTPVGGSGSSVRHDAFVPAPPPKASHSVSSSVLSVEQLASGQSANRSKAAATRPHKGQGLSPLETIPSNIAGGMSDYSPTNTTRDDVRHATDERHAGDDSDSESSISPQNFTTPSCLIRGIEPSLMSRYDDAVSNTIMKNARPIRQMVFAARLKELFTDNPLPAKLTAGAKKVLFQLFNPNTISTESPVQSIFTNNITTAPLSTIGNGTGWNFLNPQQPANHQPIDRIQPNPFIPASYSSTKPTTPVTDSNLFSHVASGSASALGSPLGALSLLRPDSLISGSKSGHFNPPAHASVSASGPMTPLTPSQFSAQRHHDDLSSTADSAISHMNLPGPAAANAAALAAAAAATNAVAAPTALRGRNFSDETTDEYWDNYEFILGPDNICLFIPLLNVILPELQFPSTPIVDTILRVYCPIFIPGAGYPFPIVSSHSPSEDGNHDCGGGGSDNESNVSVQSDNETDQMARFRSYYELIHGLLQTMLFAYFNFWTAHVAVPANFALQKPLQQSLPYHISQSSLPNHLQTSIPPKQLASFGDDFVDDHLITGGLFPHSRPLPLPSVPASSDEARHFPNLGDSQTRQGSSIPPPGGQSLPPSDDEAYNPLHYQSSLQCNALLPIICNYYAHFHDLRLPTKFTFQLEELPSPPALVKAARPTLDLYGAVCRQKRHDAVSATVAAAAAETRHANLPLTPTHSNANLTFGTSSIPTNASFLRSGRFKAEDSLPSSLTILGQSSGDDSDSESHSDDSISTQPTNNNPYRNQSNYHNANKSSENHSTTSSLPPISTAGLMIVLDNVIDMDEFSWGFFADFPENVPNAALIMASRPLDHYTVDTNHALKRPQRYVPPPGFLELTHHPQTARIVLGPRHPLTWQSMFAHRIVTMVIKHQLDALMRLFSQFQAAAPKTNSTSYRPPLRHGSMADIFAGQLAPPGGATSPQIGSNSRASITTLPMGLGLPASGFSNSASSVGQPVRQTIIQIPYTQKSADGSPHSVIGVTTTIVEVQIVGSQESFASQLTPQLLFYIGTMGGNPQLIQELPNLLKTAGHFRFSNNFSSIEFTRLFRSDTPPANCVPRAKVILPIPHHIRAILAAQNDKISPSQQLIIKVAALIGYTFNYNMLLRGVPLFKGKSSSDRQESILTASTKRDNWAIIAEDLQSLIDLGLIETVPRNSLRYEEILSVRPFSWDTSTQEAILALQGIDQAKLNRLFIQNIFSSSSSSELGSTNPLVSSSVPDDSLPATTQQPAHVQISEAHVINHQSKTQPYRFKQYPLEQLFCFRHGFLRDYLHKRTLVDHKIILENALTTANVEAHHQYEHLLPVIPQMTRIRQTKLGITAQGTQDTAPTPLCFYAYDPLMPEHEKVNIMQHQPTIMSFDILVHPNPFGRVEYAGHIASLKHRIINAREALDDRNDKYGGSLNQGAVNSPGLSSMGSAPSRGRGRGRSVLRDVYDDEPLSPRASATTGGDGTFEPDDNCPLAWKAIFSNPEHWKDKFLVLHQHAITVWNSISDFAMWVAHVIVQEYMLQSIQDHEKAFAVSSDKHDQLIGTQRRDRDISVLKSSWNIESLSLVSRFNRSSIISNSCMPDSQYRSFTALVDTYLNYWGLPPTPLDKSKTKFPKLSILPGGSEAIPNRSAASMAAIATINRNKTEDPIELPYPVHNRYEPLGDIRDFQNLFGRGFLRPNVVMSLRHCTIQDVQTHKIPQSFYSAVVAEDDTDPIMAGASEEPFVHVVGGGHRLQPLQENYGTAVIGGGNNNLDNLDDDSPTMVEASIITFNTTTWIKKGNIFNYNCQRIFKYMFLPSFEECNYFLPPQHAIEMVLAAAAATLNARSAHSRIRLLLPPPPVSRSAPNWQLVQQHVANRRHSNAPNASLAPPDASNRKQTNLFPMTTTARGSKQGEQQFTFGFSTASTKSALAIEHALRGDQQYLTLQDIQQFLSFFDTLALHATNFVIGEASKAKLRQSVRKLISQQILKPQYDDKDKQELQADFLHNINNAHIKRVLLVGEADCYKHEGHVLGSPWKRRRILLFPDSIQFRYMPEPPPPSRERSSGRRDKHSAAQEKATSNAKGGTSGSSPGTAALGSLSATTSASSTNPAALQATTSASQSDQVPSRPTNNAFDNTLEIKNGIFSVDQVSNCLESHTAVVLSSELGQSPLQVAALGMGQIKVARSTENDGGKFRSRPYVLTLSVDLWWKKGSLKWSPRSFILSFSTKQECDQWENALTMLSRLNLVDWLAHKHLATIADCSKTFSFQLDIGTSQNNNDQNGKNTRSGGYLTMRGRSSSLVIPFVQQHQRSASAAPPLQRLPTSSMLSPQIPLASGTSATAAAGGNGYDTNGPPPHLPQKSLPPPLPRLGTTSTEHSASGPSQVLVPTIGGSIENFEDHHHASASFCESHATKDRPTSAQRRGGGREINLFLDDLDSHRVAIHDVFKPVSKQPCIGCREVSRHDLATATMESTNLSNSGLIVRKSSDAEQHTGASLPSTTTTDDPSDPSGGDIGYYLDVHSSGSQKQPLARIFAASDTEEVLSPAFPPATFSSSSQSSISIESISVKSFYQSSLSDDSAYVQAQARQHLVEKGGGGPAETAAARPVAPASAPVAPAPPAIIPAPPITLFNESKQPREDVCQICGHLSLHGVLCPKYSDLLYDAEQDLLLHQESELLLHDQHQSLPVIALPQISTAAVATTAGGGGGVSSANSDTNAAATIATIAASTAVATVTSEHDSHDSAAPSSPSDKPGTASILRSPNKKRRRKALLAYLHKRTVREVRKRRQKEQENRIRRNVLVTQLLESSASLINHGSILCHHLEKQLDVLNAEISSKPQSPSTITAVADIDRAVNLLLNELKQSQEQIPIIIAQHGLSALLHDPTCRITNTNNNANEQKQATDATTTLGVEFIDPKTTQLLRLESDINANASYLPYSSTGHHHQTAVLPLRSNNSNTADETIADPSPLDDKSPQIISLSASQHSPPVAAPLSAKYHPQQHHHIDITDVIRHSHGQHHHHHHRHHHRRSRSHSSAMVSTSSHHRRQSIVDQPPITAVPGATATAAVIPASSQQQPHTSATSSVLRTPQRTGIVVGPKQVVSPAMAAVVLAGAQNNLQQCRVPSCSSSSGSNASPALSAANLSPTLVHSSSNSLSYHSDIEGRYFESEGNAGSLVNTADTRYTGPLSATATPMPTTNMGNNNTATGGGTGASGPPANAVSPHTTTTTMSTIKSFGAAGLDAPYQAWLLSSYTQELTQHKTDDSTSSLVQNPDRTSRFQVDDITPLDAPSVSAAMTLSPSCSDVGSTISSIFDAPTNPAALAAAAAFKMNNRSPHGGAGDLDTDDTLSTASSAFAQPMSHSRLDKLADQRRVSGLLAGPPNARPPVLVPSSRLGAGNRRAAPRCSVPTAIGHNPPSKSRHLNHDDDEESTADNRGSITDASGSSRVLVTSARRSRAKDGQTDIALSSSSSSTVTPGARASVATTHQSDNAAPTNKHHHRKQHRHSQPLPNQLIDPVSVIDFAYPNDDMYRSVLAGTRILLKEAHEMWERDLSAYQNAERNIQEEYAAYRRSQRANATGAVNTNTGSTTQDQNASAAAAAAAAAADNMDVLKLPESQPLWHYGIAAPLLSWSYDVFETPPDQLMLIIVRMLCAFDIPFQFQIDAEKLAAFLCLVWRFYHDNPYHCIRHAVDVTLTVWSFLTLGQASMVMTNLERFALIIASLCHDIDNPLVSNVYCYTARTSFGHFSNDQSVLENHHARVMFTILLYPQFNIVAKLSRREFNEFRNIALLAILATDMKRHMSLVESFDKLIVSLKDRCANATPRQHLTQALVATQSEFLTWLHQRRVEQGTQLLSPTIPQITTNSPDNRSALQPVSLALDSSPDCMVHVAVLGSESSESTMPVLSKHSNNRHFAAAAAAAPPSSSSSSFYLDAVPMSTIDDTARLERIVSHKSNGLVTPRMRPSVSAAGKITSITECRSTIPDIDLFSTLEVLNRPMFTFYNPTLSLTSDLPLYAFVRSITFTDRALIPQILLHAADISNPTKPWPQSKRWSDAVCNEFLIQGELETHYGLPLSPGCDRRESNLAMLNVSFIDFIVAPLFSSLSRLLPNTSILCRRMSSNRMSWCALYHSFITSTVQRLNAIYTLKKMYTMVNHILNDSSTECVGNIMSVLHRFALYNPVDHFSPSTQEQQQLQHRKEFNLPPPTQLPQLQQQGQPPPTLSLLYLDSHKIPPSSLPDVSADAALDPVLVQKINSVQLTEDENVEFGRSVFPFVAPPLPPRLDPDFLHRIFEDLTAPTALPAREYTKGKTIFHYRSSNLEERMLPRNPNPDTAIASPQKATSQHIGSMPAATVKVDLDYWHCEAEKWKTRSADYYKTHSVELPDQRLISSLRQDSIEFAQHLYSTLEEQRRLMSEGVTPDDAVKLITREQEVLTTPTQEELSPVVVHQYPPTSSESKSAAVENHRQQQSSSPLITIPSNLDDKHTFSAASTPSSSQQHVASSVSLTIPQPPPSATDHHHPQDSSLDPSPGNSLLVSSSSPAFNEILHVQMQRVHSHVSSGDQEPNSNVTKNANRRSTPNSPVNTNGGAHSNTNNTNPRLVKASSKNVLPPIQKQKTIDVLVDGSSIDIASSPTGTNNPPTSDVSCAPIVEQEDEGGSSNLTSQQVSPRENDHVDFDQSKKTSSKNSTSASTSQKKTRRRK